MNGPSLISNCLLIILVIGSCVILDGFPSRFWKCCFHSFILSCWLAAFSFALAVFFLLLTSFIVCQAILDCLSSTEYINDDVTNHNEQRPKRRTWTREENKLELECYFRCNPSQRGYRKRMFEIWPERSTFQTTSQRLADQVRTITKKGWFSDLVLLEIHQKPLKQIYYAVPDTPSGVEQEQSNEKEPQTSANENTTVPNDTLSNNQVETLSQEQKVNLENVKRIMNSEKTILPSLRNIEWKTLKIETNKIDHILPYIPMNNITELNELIYAGAKLVCENIGIPSKKQQQKTRRNSKNRDGKLDWNRK